LVRRLKRNRLRDDGQLDAPIKQGQTLRRRQERAIKSCAEWINQRQLSLPGDS